MKNPIKLFSQWFQEAEKNPHISDHTVMTLATANRKAAPSVRVVLLKAFDERGFVFYTNMESRKSQELKENPHASLCFYWQPLGRQVRIEGKVEQVSDKEANEYFNSRPFISRIGAWASKQSSPLVSRETLMKKVEELQKAYSETNPPPRPPHWSGWRLTPSAIEFWQEGEFRLHDRDLYTRDGAGWKVQKLYP
jgi:pyridoxamine 5'-phosphate oxidase